MTFNYSNKATLLTNKGQGLPQFGYNPAYNSACVATYCRYNAFHHHSIVAVIMPKHSIGEIDNNNDNGWYHEWSIDGTMTIHGTIHGNNNDAAAQNSSQF